MNQSFYWILWLREKILVEFQSKIGVDVDSDVNLLAWKIMYYSRKSEQSRNDIVWKTQEKRSQKYWKKACETLLFMNGLMTYLSLRSASAQILIFLLSNCKHPTEKFTLIYFFTRVVSHHHTAKKKWRQWDRMLQPISNPIYLLKLHASHECTSFVSMSCTLATYSMKTFTSCAFMCVLYEIRAKKKTTLG